MKKKVGIAVLIFVIVSLAVTCGWQFQKQRSVTSELAEARANLSTEQQENADLAGRSTI